MRLAAGTRMGVYEITAAIGAGGMGEVYRARDAKLDRDVALKILPESFASDPDRLMRFEREAKTLASLNHPNIAAIYGIEDRALVMELVEGEDLSARTARGPIPLDEVLPIAKQIAEALEAAHEQGIIHRDLKPANIKLRPDGTVKVLDFGLAKALEPGSGIGDPGSATITSPAMTMHGVILGTAAYMSPEQAKGKPVDKRADIWAFGVVLYEMLTGKRAFEGEDITDTIVAVVSREPDWSRLPTATPPALRRLLQRCLTKDARRRLRDIGDARIEVDEPSANESGARVVPARGSVSVLAPWALAAILAIALAASWVLMTPAPAPNGARYPIDLAEGQRIGPTSWAPMAVSPDGSRLVYVGESNRLLVRSRDRIESVALPGTEGAFNPFFSPDGASVGFMEGQPGSGQLRVVSLEGGPPSLITSTAVGGPGASWGTDGYIYYDASGVGPLRRVKAIGGESEVISTLDEAAGELQHDWPDALPGGRGVLITINRGGPGVNISQSDDVGVLDLATRRHRVLVHGVLGRYAASGHLVFITAEGVLLAAPFDEVRMEVTGNPVALIEGINLRLESGGIDVALSRSGTLWYATGIRMGHQEVLWATAGGEITTVEAGWTGAFESLALSPDASKLALSITDGVGQQIWLKDLSRPNGTLSKITQERANKMPRWHPDGTRVTFTSALAGKNELRSARIDGTGEQSVLADDLYVVDGGYTRDGRWLVYSGPSNSSRVFREDIHAIRLGADAKPQPLVTTPFNERGASVSPDGRWLLFQSNLTGRPEIYVRPFPDTAASQSPVSSGGGSQPKWSRDGREIYYANGNQLTRVTVVPGPSFAVGKPSTVLSLAGVQDWDVAADGRIIFIRSAEAEKGGQLIVVEDFFDELRRKVPTK